MKKEDNKKVSSTNDSLKYPLDFTPREYVETDVERSKQRNGYVTEVGEEVKLYDDMKSGSERIFSQEDVGNSGGILCVWDTNSFKKLNATVSVNFVMIRGN
ncbi:hypothetical protein Tco_1126721 [Tanacetum coccineum]